MMVLVEVFGIFCPTISESKTETMCIWVPCAPPRHIVVFNAMGRQYGQTISITYLGGAATET